MDLVWSMEQKRIRQDFAALGEGVARNAPSAHNSATLDSESWQAISDAGIWRYPIADAHGGAGKTWWEFAAALEGLATTTQDLGFLLSVIAQAGAIHAVNNFGTDRQKGVVLQRLLKGDVAATAATEPHGGSDVARVRTAAHNKGNRLILSGHKAHITNAPIAEILVILGRVPSLGARQDITLFVFERDNTLGLTTSTAESTLGHRSSPTGDIVLKDVTVEPDNILGAAGGGLAMLYDMLLLDRLLYAFVAGGFGEHLLGRAMSFAANRSSFNRPISDHQRVQDKIVEIRTNMEIARCLAYTALDRMLRQDDDAALLSSMAKLVGSEGLWRSAQELLQLHGHAGYVDGPVSRMFADAAATRIAGGTTEMQKLNIFNQLNRQQKWGRQDNDAQGGDGSAQERNGQI